MAESYIQLPSVNETWLTYVARTILTAHTLDTDRDQHIFDQF